MSSAGTAYLNDRQDNAKEQTLVVLGSTGSIGINTLEVVRGSHITIFALVAHQNVEKMAAQCREFTPKFAVMYSERAAKELAILVAELGLKTQVLWGVDAINMVASHEEVDMVMAAIVGMAGLPACLAAARAGKRILLANKEAIVVGGDFFVETVRTHGGYVLPIDSEHSAIFQSLQTQGSALPLGREQLVQSGASKIILTASGGPFRTRDPETFSTITPEEACKHPNWVMGRKISVDSATMMNKALEVIEAHFLFGFRSEEVDVVIHPQSVIHSMVQYVDGSVIAQLGTPDMRVPIAYGLAWPHRMSSGSSPLDFGMLSGGLQFELLDDHGHEQRYPALALARWALKEGGSLAAELNAANEVAVEAFLQKRIRFDQIHQVAASGMVGQSRKVSSLEELVAIDQEARSITYRMIRVLAV